MQLYNMQSIAACFCNFKNASIKKFSLFIYINGNLTDTGLGSYGDKVLALVDEFVDENEERRCKVTFAGKQLLAFYGSRYS